MKIFIRYIGLALLALFCFNSSFSQNNDLDKEERIREIKALRKSFADGKSYYLNHVDTSKLVQLQLFEDYNSDEKFYFAEVDSAHVGVLSESLLWLIEPKYCAISDFDPERGVASVRACPFSHSYQKMNYWENEPTYDNWGVVDTAGNWLIEPVYVNPLKIGDSAQLAYSYEKGYVPIINLKEKWLSEFDNAAIFGSSAYVLKQGDKTGLRSANGDWIIPKGHYKLVRAAGYILLFDTIQIDRSNVFSCLKIDTNYQISNTVGAKPCLELLSDISYYIEMAGEDIEVMNESISNPNYLISDSSFAVWFVLKYWVDLFGNSNDNLRRYQVDYATIDDVFADTIYTNKPSDFYEFYRIEETDSWFNINQNGKTCYSVLQHEYTVNYGSRGPAYERMAYSLINVQIANNKAYELELVDCFKNRDSTVLSDYIKKYLPDSFNMYWEHIKLNEALWKIQKDSIVFFFPNTAMNNYYSEFEYDYKRIAFARKQIGRKFLSDRRRKRKLLKH
ncbi:MAG: hypothetical protein JXQ87_02760 [Bacteroidia bacterium]